MRSKWGLRFAIIYLYILILICLIFNANAEISINCGFYDSDDELTMELTGENIQFGSSISLMPDSISFDNEGRSTYSECKYDSRLSLNGESLNAGTDTNQGIFKWKAEAKAVPMDDQVLVLSAQSAVNNGVLTSYYSNSNNQVKQNIETENGMYMESTSIDPNSLKSNGKGSSLETNGFYTQKQTLNDKAISSEAQLEGGAFMWTSSIGSKDNVEQSILSADTVVRDGHMELRYLNQDVESQESIDVNNAIYNQQSKISLDEITSRGMGTTTSKTKSELGKPGENDPDAKGLYQVLNLNTGGKCARIELDIKGDIKAQWNSGMDYNQAIGSIGMGIQGYSNTHSTDKFEMLGLASDFPTQRLPAGDVEVAYSMPELNDKLKEDAKRIAEEQEAFESIYPGLLGPMAWYHQNQKMYINPIYVPPVYGKTSEPVDYFYMGMGFHIRDS